VQAIIVLILSTWTIDLSVPGGFPTGAPAFGKNKERRAERRAERRQERRAARRNGVENEGETGEAEGNADPGGAVDFHDEGFASRPSPDIKIRRDRDHEDDFDRSRKHNLEDGLGAKDKLDLKFLKDNLPGNFGANDKIDPKLLKELGNAEEFVTPLNAGPSQAGGPNAGGESRGGERGRAAGRDRAAIGGEQAARPSADVKEPPLGDKLDLKSVKTDLGVQEYMKLLNADAGKTEKPPSGTDSSAQEKGAAARAEKADQAAQPELQALKEQRRELKGEISELKDERKEATTKEERKEIKAEIKELKNELKDVKEAIKTAKGAQAGESAEAAVASGRPDPQIGNIRENSYASKEVLALGLSPRASERVTALGFQVSNSALEYGNTTLRTLSVPSRMDALEALRLLRRELSGDAFYLNRLYRPYLPSKNDNQDKDPQPDPGPGGGNCLADKCYSRSVIRWNDELSKCTHDISIGVIDTGVDLKHPTFGGQKILQKTFLSEGKKVSPNWHGTGILALLAGRPDSSTPGLVPEAKFFVASSFFADDDGAAMTDTVSLLRSLEWMEQSGAKVINMSFTGPDDVLVQGRLKTLRSKGLVFTAAAGNDGPAASPNYPAAYPEVVAVTAVTKDLRVYPSANRGPYIDLAAPGVRIWTALPAGREGYQTGTSFATPFATALLALQRPDILSGPEEELLDNLRTVPLGTGERNPIYGRGLLQAPSECPSSRAVVSSKAPPPAR
jgi:subtilisin family serine protease